MTKVQGCELRISRCESRIYQQEQNIKNPKEGFNFYLAANRVKSQKKKLKILNLRLQLLKSGVNFYTIKTK